MPHKKYKLDANVPSADCLRLDQQFRQVARSIDSLGMVLGKDAPGISREFDTAYQLLCSRSGFLRHVTLTQDDLKAFEHKIDAVKAEIAMHNSKAEVLKDLRRLRVECVGYIKRYESETPSDTASALLSLSSPSRKPEETLIPINSAKLVARVIDGEVYIRLADVAGAFTGALEYYTGQLPEHKKTPKKEKSK